MKMLIDNNKIDRELKTASFKIDRELFDNFRQKCKQHRIKQVSIIVNAMKKALEEIEQLEKELK